ncbi:hypothetical protein V493_03887 [Pseudogymnoascus sp. VKM F-4281 (FW-2241)]|nr:hypothetical protein V493_03887 [Pseudogymnoascus sp. VKM F-4281 (FW-2241)]
MLAIADLSQRQDSPHRLQPYKAPRLHTPNPNPNPNPNLHQHHPPLKNQPQPPPPPPPTAPPHPGSTHPSESVHSATAPDS